MQAAWIGVLGAILGALVTIFGTEWIQGPKEGIFSVDYNAMTNIDVDPSLRDQVTKFPITIRISHVTGPAIKDISVALNSNQTFENFEIIQEDEKAHSSSIEKSINIDIPVLRKGSILQYRAISLGSPTISMNVVHGSGQLISRKDSANEPWFMNENVIIIGLFAGVILFGAFLIYLFRAHIAAAELQPTEFAIISAVFILSIFPFGFGFSDAIVIVLLFSILRRMKKVELATAKCDPG